MNKLKQLLKNPDQISSTLDHDLLDDENRFLLQQLYLYSQLDDKVSFDKILKKNLRFLEGFGFEAELITDGHPSSQEFNIELEHGPEYTFLNFALKSMPTDYVAKIVDCAEKEDKKGLLKLSQYASRSCIQEAIVNSIKNHNQSIIEKVLNIFEVSEKTMMQTILIDQRDKLASHIDSSILKNPYVLIETLNSSNYSIISNKNSYMYGQESEKITYESNNNLLFHKSSDYYTSQPIRKNIVQAVLDIDPSDIAPQSELRKLLKDSLVKICIENSKYYLFAAHAQNSLVSKGTMQNHIEFIIQTTQDSSSYSYSTSPLDQQLKCYSIITELIEKEVFYLNEEFSYRTYDGQEFLIPINKLMEFKHRKTPEVFQALEATEKMLKLQNFLPEKSEKQNKMKI